MCFFARADFNRRPRLSTVYVRTRRWRYGRERERNEARSSRNRSNPVNHGRGRLPKPSISISFPDRASAFITALRASEGSLASGRGRARAYGRFLSRGEDHSVHRRHLIANLSHLALPHKLNDRLNGWPSRYAKERFFGYFAKYPVKDFDGPLRSSMPRRRRVGRRFLGSFRSRALTFEIIANEINLPRRDSMRD